MTTSDISACISALKTGKPVVFPTDTVVGLGVAAAYAPDPQALFAIKRRKPGKPIAWLVGGVDAIDVYGMQVPDYARNLAHAFWPGALTLVVKASSLVPTPYQSSTGTIALRMPSHTSCLELVRQVGPLATSSANLSGSPAPTRVADIDSSIAHSVACIFDDGVASSGVASTVVDCTGPTPCVLRQGSVSL